MIVDAPADVLGTRLTALVDDATEERLRRMLGE